MPIEETHLRLFTGDQVSFISPDYDKTDPVIECGKVEKLTTDENGEDLLCLAVPVSLDDVVFRKVPPTNVFTEDELMHEIHHSNNIIAWLNKPMSELVKYRPARFTLAKLMEQAVAERLSF